MRKSLTKKILFVVLFALAMVAIVNVHVGATGYTYDHKGNVIYSTEGFTSNQTPYIYSRLGIDAKTFTEANPTDLFVYTDDDMGAKDEAIGDTLVYLLDSGGNAKNSTIYVFNSSLELQREISSLRYNPATLVANGTDLTKIKSGKTLVAKSTATALTHKVTFIDPLAGDEVISEQDVVDSKAATAVLPKNHEGYYFAGWSTEFNCVIEDITVEAKYIDIAQAQSEIEEARAAGETLDDLKTVTVTFVEGEDDDKVELGSLVIKAGTSTLALPVVEEKEGYIFNGWLYDGKAFTENTTVKADIEVSIDYEKLFTVKFVDSENENAVIKKELVANEKAATAPFVPFYENKVFKEWSVKFDKVTKDLTVSTVYEDDPNAITVTFVDSISGDVIGKYNVSAGNDVIFPTPTSYDAYQFASWDSDGKGITEPTTITANYTKKTNGISLETLLNETDMTLYMAGTNSIYRGVASNSSPHTDYIYICDTANNQILVLDAKSYEETEPGKGTYEIAQIITSPVGEIGSKTFSPLKAVNDAAGRVYAICEGIEDGILEFSKAGSFDRYVGTNYVTLSAWEIFTRNFATEAQLDQFTTYQNTTFTSMVYKNNMIYTTSYSITNSNGSINDTIMIKKINPSGKDVLRRNGYNIPKGDLKYIQYNDDQGAIGTSQFVGITVNDYGVYTVVDNKRGRLFTYDNEGNLLYVSGGSGTQLDKINIPIAVQYLGDNILVLDSKRKAIIVYEPTDIAKVINEAIKCEYRGESEKAYEYWERVIQLNANYEYAYVGIGKHYMEATDVENNYKIAMENFELGANQVYYSKAYKQYRDAIIKAWFPWVAGGLIALIVGGTVYKKVRRKKLGIKEEEMTGMGDE